MSNKPSRALCSSGIPLSVFWILKVCHESSISKMFSNRSRSGLSS